MRYVISIILVFVLLMALPADVVFAQRVRVSPGRWRPSPAGGGIWTHDVITITYSTGGGTSESYEIRCNAGQYAAGGRCHDVGAARSTPTCRSAKCGGDSGGGAAPTPTPRPPTPTPIPQGTVRARAVTVPPGASCTEINASTNYLDGTQLTITGQAQQTQGAGSYVQWANIPAGGYTLSATFPSEHALVGGCWSRTLTSPTSGTGMGASFTASGEALTWNVGAVPPGPWVQTRGGDVSVATAIQSLLPATAQPSRYFSLTGSGGYPGVLRYGTSYDFQIDTGTGGSYISPTNWNALATDRYTVDYYDLFWRKFGGPTTPDFDAEDLLLPLAQPVSRATPYYAVGNATTTGNWVVPAGETLILLVDGNLTIGGRVTTTGTGFVAFIVKGNITIDPSVGTTYSSTIPVLEGVFITSPTGTFSTGPSTSPGSERLVGQGMFVAGAFQLQRDLSSVAQNANYAAEYFIYDPSLLLTMPEAMMDTAVTWSEVAP